MHTLKSSEAFMFHPLIAPQNVHGMHKLTDFSSGRPVLAAPRVLPHRSCCPPRSICSIVDALSTAQISHSTTNTSSPAEPAAQTPSGTPNSDASQAQRQSAAPLRLLSMPLVGFSAFILHSLALPEVAQAASHLEPANALSIPTW